MRKYLDIRWGENCTALAGPSFSNGTPSSRRNLRYLIKVNDRIINFRWNPCLVTTWFRKPKHADRAISRRVMCCAVPPSCPDAVWGKFGTALSCRTWYFTYTFSSNLYNLAFMSNFLFSKQPGIDVCSIVKKNFGHRDAPASCKEAGHL